MKHLYSCLLLVSLVWSLQQRAHAEEVTLPAGTLLSCTLDEPNFSSASAQVGDPVICHLRGVQQFGRVVFPRGAYLAGRLAAEKDPGHFLGKGWLKLAFDHISLPDAALPVPGKIVAVPGYRVNSSFRIRYASPSIPAMQSEPASTPLTLKDGTIYGVTDYWIEGDRLFYALSNGTERAFDLNQVDWGRTTQIGAEIGVAVSLRPRSKDH